MDTKTAPDCPFVAAHDGWRYWRPETGGIFEFGTLRGGAPGLVPHFHADAQVTLVLAGRRALLVDGRTVELTAGRCLCIPAGVPHGSRDEPPDVVGLIAFLPAGRYAFDRLVADVERCWSPGGGAPLQDLAALVERHRLGDGAGAAHTPAPPTDVSREPIGWVAARSGMSREGFTRRFARRSGMPPHAFRLADRLDRAKRLLRTGLPIAEVAAATGFSDQSHLGRHFKRAYGVSPGSYRRG